MQMTISWQALTRHQQIFLARVYGIDPWDGDLRIIDQIWQWLANEGQVYLIILIVVTVAIGAFYVYFRYKKKQEAQLQAVQEQQNRKQKLILKLAADNKGYITAAEISLISDLSLDEATNMLDILKAKGACILRVSDTRGLSNGDF